MALIILNACSNKPENFTSSDSQQVETSTEQAEEPESYSSMFEEEEMPVPDFLTREQQAVYRQASTAYKQFVYINDGFGSEQTGESDFEIDDIQYYKCNGYITSWKDFESAMLSVFTPEYFDELNKMASYTDESGELHERTIFAEKDGDLYFSGGARGGNILFVPPETFKAIYKTDDEIQFEVIGTYSEDGADKERFPITMVKTDNGWRFSQFNIAY